MSPYNTRLFKSEDGIIPSYTIVLASAVEGPAEDDVGKLVGNSTVFEKCEFKIERGRFGVDQCCNKMLVCVRYLVFGR